MNKLFEKLKSLSDIQKFLLVSIPLFLVILYFIMPFFGTQSTKVPFYLSDGSQMDSPKSISIPAQKGKVKNNRYAVYKFTDDDLSSMESQWQNDKSLSLYFSFESSPKEEENQFKLSFLWESDFDDKGNYISQAIDRVEVSGDISRVSNNGKITIGFAVPKSETSDKPSLPKGFFFSSQKKLTLKNVELKPSIVGFVSGDVPFFSFSSAGGKLLLPDVSFDFSGCSLDFPVYETASSNMPSYLINLKKADDDKNFKQEQIDVLIGGETIRIKTAPGVSQVLIPTLPLKEPFSTVEIKKGQEFVSSFLMIPTQANYKSLTFGKVLTPYSSDPGLILNWPESKWRCQDYELFSWSNFPNYLIFDFKNYAVQSKFLGRLAFFVEKQGYKGKLLTNEELIGKHDYNAHDYSCESLAKFFTEASKSGFVLNPEEELLKEILLYNGVILSDGTGYCAGKGCVLSISKESNLWLRERLFSHEGWHMFYFSDEEFRNYITACFYTCDENSKRFLIDYFKSQESLGYDTDDDYLLQNEFMAYLLQQPQSQVGEYFVSLANRGSVMKYTKDLAKYIRDTKGAGFEDAAGMINDYVFDRWGISGGNIFLVRR